MKFTYYIYRVNGDMSTPIYRFENKSDALKAVVWLNLYCKYSYVMKEEKLDFYQLIDKNDITRKFKNFNDFLNIQTNLVLREERKDLCYFVKYDNMWWEYDISTDKKSAIIHNLKGGRMSQVDLTDYELVRASDFSNLDWSNTILLDNNYKTGWLSPNGEFYGCDYALHDLQAEMVHHVTEKDLEKRGFVKISYNYDDRKLHAHLGFNRYSNIPLTKEQYDFLKDYGIDNLKQLVNFSNKYTLIQ